MPILITLRNKQFVRKTFEVSTKDFGVCKGGWTSVSYDKKMFGFELESTEVIGGQPAPFCAH